MKHHGSKSLYVTLRNQELYNAYLQELAAADHINVREVCRLAALHPCSQFWISEERAREVIRQLDHGIPIEQVARGKKCYKSTADSESYRAMIEELYGVYKRLRSENPEASVFELTCMAVNSPASQFFLTPESARKCIYKYRRVRSIMDRLRNHAQFINKNK